MDTKFLFWQRWLVCLSVVITLFGLWMAFFSRTDLFAVVNNHYNAVFWGTANAPSNVVAFQEWMYGAWGGTVAGWGVFLVFISMHPFRNLERWSWYCMAGGLSLWFVVDTYFSAAFRVYPNVALNILLFMAAMIPLVFTVRYFFSKSG